MEYDEKEFQALYKTFQPAILRYLARLAGENEAEDLTQEVFMRIRRSIGSFRGESSLSTWVFRIAANAALDKLRSPAFKKPARGPEGDPGQDTPDNGPSPDQRLIRNEMNECIRSFIEKLPEQYRDVIVLSELEEKKNSEISEILGVTVGTVKIRLHRARAMLKEELASNCNFYQDQGKGLSCDRKGALNITF
ncbi:MAG: sigma-70 family RNA polymerase sigma factor [Nitrospinae bacterium]|nr:sigma-70 family RNA polymerase sigma factor [Nitrospinota bacterium]